MKTHLLIFLSALSISTFAQNSCSEALPVELGIYTVDAINGELPFPTCYGNNGFDYPNRGMWYSFTSETDAYISISSNLPQNSGGDTRLQIYTGTCEELVCFGGADDLQGGNYLTTWLGMLPGGDTYYLAWDNRWSSNGFDFKISLEEIPAIAFTPVQLSGWGTKLGVVDMNSDNLDDIVSVTSEKGLQITYQQPDGSLMMEEVPSEIPGVFPTWSMVAGDITGNGYNDLVFGGGNAVSFLYANDDASFYRQVTYPQYVFSQRTNCIDINNDGHLDVFVCHDTEPNVYFINDGDSLHFHQGGIGDFPQGGNYGSIWIDYDNDGDMDLFISKCRGGGSDAKINELHRNNGDGTFTEVGVILGLNDPMQAWSAAWGDFDNDGDLDVMIGVSSFSDGGHKLLRNEGGWFVDVTAGSGIDLIMDTGRENICHDFDNDGFIDILGLGNTYLSNNGDMTFTRWVLPFGNGPIGDLNNDGFLDVVNGGQLYLNLGNDNNYVKVIPQGVESNTNGIGSTITVYTPSGNFMRQVVSGDGFKFMSSLTAHFGLGQEAIIDSIKIVWPSGNVDVHLDLLSNTTHVLVEGQGSQSVGIEKKELDYFLVYPNPAQDYILIDFPLPYKDLHYAIYDMNGKLVMNGSANGKTVNISKLNTGVYLLQVTIDGRKLEKKIIKE